MDETAFCELLTAVTQYIVKHDTVMRPAVSPKERLTATLRFLATGRQLEDLKFSTGISPQSLGKIIPETCSAIFHAMRGQYLKVTCFVVLFIFGGGSKSGKSVGPWGSMPPEMYITFQRATLVYPSWCMICETEKNRWERHVGILTHRDCAVFIIKITM